MVCLRVTQGNVSIPLAVPTVVESLSAQMVMNCTRVVSALLVVVILVDVIAVDGRTAPSAGDPIAARRARCSVPASLPALVMRAAELARFISGDGNGWIRPGEFSPAESYARVDFATSHAQAGLSLRFKSLLALCVKLQV